MISEFCAKYNSPHNKKDGKKLTDLILSNRVILNKIAAFSLVELLMALLVASLLMAALAPVMTKKTGEDVTINANVQGGGSTIYEIEYNSSECETKGTNPDGSEYCEGTFTVPSYYTGMMKVTLVGAGGGGGTAPTAGYVEYTTVSDLHTFTVPAMTGEIETTLVSGGSGGKAGNYAISTWEKLTGQKTNWSVPDIAKNKYVNIELCGAGGGRGVSDNMGSGGGGAGAYVKKAVELPSVSSISVIIGGKGGNAGETPQAGSSYGGGGGGATNFGGGKGADGIGGDGGIGDWYNAGSVSGSAGTNRPTAGKGATDSGGNGSCILGAISPIGSGAGGNSGKILLTTNPGETFYMCTGGSGGNIGGGGGAGSTSGGGGGGGAASSFGSPGNSYYVIASGGGGGGAYAGTGGGGGGLYGGYGGDACINGSSCNQGSGGYGGRCDGQSICTPGGSGESSWNGSAYRAGNSAPSPTNVFLNNCGGEKNGAIKISYLTAGNAGGSGGGAGAIIQNKKINVTPAETLHLNIGAGGNGAKAPYINASSNIITQSTGTEGSASKILRNTTILANTGQGSNTGNGANGTNGGGGAIINIPGLTTCTPGSGGTSSSQNGKNATGYGCGGGGGYTLSDGGKGSGGYARISWNKYWNTAVNSYKTSGNNGGGGAGGNILTYTISVNSGETIKFKIGKGGTGAYVQNNTVIPAQNGGFTEFGKLKAGGGFGGNSPQANDDGIFSTGTGGNPSTICTYNGKNLLNNSECTQSSQGKAGDETAGGAGANIADKKTEYGTGGNGGIQDKGENSNGKAATGYGAGGGGAAIRDLDRVESPSGSQNNPNSGGSGAHGKIILQWY